MLHADGQHRVQGFGFRHGVSDDEDHLVFSFFVADA
jgi:hypothetical protein